MILKTATSLYELEHDKEKEEYTLTKLAILPGKSSAVPVGETWKGNRVVLDLMGKLLLYNNEQYVTDTSPLRF